eukprot:CAMPEP_0116118950 /NCGR_PEP_ID=MMETSP0329-20121206/2382_1 /TAXON_ID=697910 /ORGANISM="Pseudo-nitzschia arenysensis, Strain B593" /LENGTH=579 /DNA_ID=CAMNT_0003612621 /DNA_START=129 /DNA_END=1868 /DNA_ORIENTATION=+
MSQKLSSSTRAALETELDQGSHSGAEDESSEFSTTRVSQNASNKPSAPLLVNTLPRDNDGHPQNNNEQEVETNFQENIDLNDDIVESIFLEQILFFLAGLGSSIGYIATLSSLVYFKILFGANSFVYLNCAVFLPLLPISIAQAIWDSQFDLLWQSRVTFLVRGVLGYGFVIAGTFGMVTFAHGEKRTYIDRNSDDSVPSGEGLEWIICWALLQGIGGAILFGLLNQLASFVGTLHQNQTPLRTNNIYNNFIVNPTDNSDPSASDEDEILPKKFKATVSAGVQASALVVLLASITSGFGTMNETYFSDFLIRILQVECFCFAAFLWLLMARPRIQVSMMRRDSSMREMTRYSSGREGFQELVSPLEDHDGDDDDDDEENDSSLRLPLLQRRPSPNDINSQSSGEVTILSLRDLLYYSRIPCLGMALTLVPSFLVGSWFTRVQTDWMQLAQILFYVRIGSDLIGRFATILIPPSSIECVVMTAGLRCIAVVIFFANASCKIPLRQQWDRDALSIGLVVFIAFCSGYLVTSCYQLAPQQLLVTPIVRAANVAKQSSLLTVAFAMSAIGGLITSFVLVAIGV